MANRVPELAVGFPRSPIGGQLALQDVEVVMLPVLAVLLFLVFGGLGFAAHILWLGLILAAIVAIVHVLTRNT